MPALYLHSDPDKRYCSRGKHYVSKSEFGRDAARKDGLHPYCRACCADYRKRYFAKPENAATRRAYDRKRNKEPARRSYRQAMERRRRGLMTGKIEVVEQEALEKQNGPNCCLCGKPLGTDCTVEHKTPLSRGGSHTLANLGLAHLLCNMRKGRLTLEEWEDRQAAK